MLRSDFSLTKKNQSRAPSFLLFREKSRSVRLLVCKRTRDGSQSLPTFHDIAPSAQPKSPAATAFAGKSCKNARTTSRRAFWFAVFFLYCRFFTQKPRTIRLPACKRVQRFAIAANILRYWTTVYLENVGMSVFF